MQFKDAVFIRLLSLLLRLMQREVAQVVSLTGTDLDFYLLNVGAIARNYTYTTIEIFLWIELFRIFKRVARKAEVMYAVETKDEVIACRPITPHQIPALTE